MDKLLPAPNILWLIILLISCTNVIAQSFLVLEKIGTKKRYEIHTGTTLDVRIKDDDFFSRITILGLTDSAIQLQGRLLPIKDITALDLSAVRPPSFARKSGAILMVAGAGLLLIDILNQTAVQGGSYESSSGLFITAAAITVTGALLTFVKKDKKKIKGWWRLRIVQLPN